MSLMSDSGNAAVCIPKRKEYEYQLSITNTPIKFLNPERQLKMCLVFLLSNVVLYMYSYVYLILLKENQDVDMLAILYGL